MNNNLLLMLIEINKDSPKYILGLALPQWIQNDNYGDQERDTKKHID